MRIDNEPPVSPNQEQLGRKETKFARPFTMRMNRDHEEILALTSIGTFALGGALYLVFWIFSESPTYPDLRGIGVGTMALAAPGALYFGRNLVFDIVRDIRRGIHFLH